MENPLVINIIPENDAERVAVLRQYRIMDSPREQVFDEIIALACQMFDTPAGLISLVDKDRVYFKANYRDGVTFSEREKNICSFVVLEENILVIENAQTDYRVRTNPAVTGPEHIRFYAGAPLVGRDGYILGTICVIDVKPRKFDTRNQDLLKSLAKMVMERMEYRLADIEKSEKRQTIQQLNEELTTTNAKLNLAVRRLARANYELEEAQLMQSDLLEQLRISETRLRQAIESGNMGTWSVEPQTDRVQLSDRGREILGFSNSEEVFLNGLVNTISDDYKVAVGAALQNAVTHLQDIDSIYPVNHLITGQRRWIRTTGKSFYDGNGNPASYSGMLMDITEQKQDEERKNDFIGMVSHELKTPLTSISGYIELLQMNKPTVADPFAASVLEKSYMQVSKMTAMINSFLNVSRLESGKLEISKSKFVLSDLVQETIEEARIVQSRHCIVFEPCNPVTVFADRDKIGSVISNLLSNAIKYSAAGTAIYLSCGRDENGTVQVSVKDEGVGISADDMAKLFERYYRVKGNSSVSGFGIGLYLSAEIIQRHNGKIWVESEIGKGSTFHFSIPVQ